jgi:hypothetical protein
MKKALTFLFLQLLVAPLLVAQISAKKVLIDSNLSFSSKNFNNENTTYYQTPGKVTSFSTETSVGKLVNDKLALGISLLYASERAKDNIDRNNITSGAYSLSNFYDIKTSSFAPGLYARYFIKITDNFYFTPRFDCNYLWERRSSKLGIQENYSKSQVNKLNLGLSSSLLYSINNWIGVQLKFVNFNTQFKLKDSRLPDANQKGTSINLNINPSNWEYGIVIII